MKVSLSWLQKHIDAPLPSAREIADALTFHSWEIEEEGDGWLDVKVLPNRAADALSHRGIARDLAAILDLPAKPDPLRAIYEPFKASDELSIEVEDARLCSRYMGAVVKGVKVGPSPTWLKEALESVGQRSINNVVDATNYVMLDLGQPLHAFDAAKLGREDGKMRIGVRSGVEAEKTTILSGEEYALPSSALVIEDAISHTVIGIAGVKGAKPAEITLATTDIVIEAANFDSTSVRKTAQALKLWTDAGKRFQNGISPELVAYAMTAVVAIIKETAGGELAGVIDQYPAPVETTQVPVSVGQINTRLGTDFTADDVEGVWRRLGFPCKRLGDDFTINPHFERRDLLASEDLVEEVGRILGYDRVPSSELPPLSHEPDQARYRGIERVKDFLVEKGFIEISTQSFAKDGDIMLANPLDVAMPALRKSLKENMKAALEKAKHYAPRVLAPKAKPKLFEIGTVFAKDGEELMLETSEPVEGIPELVADNAYEPREVALGIFEAYSAYPFATRDIALWVPSGTEGSSVAEVIRGAAGTLLVRLDEFDRFEKDGRVSYAFRLVFESMERTLADEELAHAMEKVNAAVAAKGYEVR
ncbi:MAG: phenylalanine--tRNA ligase subunit beta [Candidatus Pacebacteria bacterium]|nr:phenylalanine--tRNA ligase subunit beta [Candidatus Paceibacterota bacterium]MBP9840784.1 phenylalanine--tRNA ligase subunit beta [Candidatus Paceibacterota bacterium]